MPRSRPCSQTSSTSKTRTTVSLQFSSSQPKMRSSTSAGSSPDTRPVAKTSPTPPSCHTTPQHSDPPIRRAPLSMSTLTVRRQTTLTALCSCR